MGKKRVSLLGTEGESELRAKKAIKLEQKKLREGKVVAKAPGLKGGQRVVDTAAESLAEYEAIQAKQASTEETPSTPIKSKRRIRIRSTNYVKAKKLVADQNFPLTQAVALLSQVSLAKFGGSVELHLNLKSKITPKSIELPYSTGKTKKIGVVDDKFIKSLEDGKPDLNLDVLLCSVSDMPKLVKYAKILGPKGLMPNPKNGTVVANPKETAQKMTSAGTTTIKTEKDAPLIHLVVGKLSQPPKELIANIEAILKTLSAAQVSISKAVLKTTMSPAVKLQL